MPTCARSIVAPALARRGRQGRGLVARRRDDRCASPARTSQPSPPIDRASAEAGLAAIGVDYAPKPAVTSLAAARRKDAPLVYENRFWRTAVNGAEGPVLPMPWSGNRRGPVNGFSHASFRRNRRLPAASRRNDPLLVTARSAPPARAIPASSRMQQSQPSTAAASSCMLSTQAAQYLAGRIAARTASKMCTVHAEHVGGGFGSKVGMGIGDTSGARAVASSRQRPCASSMTAQRNCPSRAIGQKPRSRVQAAARQLTAGSNSLSVRDALQRRRRRQFDRLRPRPPDVSRPMPRNSSTRMW